MSDAKMFQPPICRVPKKFYRVSFLFLRCNPVGVPAAMPLVYAAIRGAFSYISRMFLLRENASARTIFTSTIFSRAAALNLNFSSLFVKQYKMCRQGRCTRDSHLAGIFVPIYFVAMQPSLSWNLFPHLKEKIRPKTLLTLGASALQRNWCYVQCSACKHVHYMLLFSPDFFSLLWCVKNEVRTSTLLSFFIIWNPFFIPPWICIAAFHLVWET